MSVTNFANFCPPRPLAHWRLRPLVYNFWISNALNLTSRKMNTVEMVSTRHQYDKWVSGWQSTVFVIGDIFWFLGPPLRHIFTLFLLIVITLIICWQNNQQIVFHNDQWSNHRIIIAQIWPKITTLTTCEIWDFQAPLKSSFQIIFSWYSYQWLYVIRPTKVLSYIMIW